MKVRVGDADVPFDVEGASLVPMGAWMVERPTVVLVGEARPSRLLGASLAEVAQVVYLDDRGTDLRGFCEALDIRRPCLVTLGGDEESADRLGRGLPALVLRVDDPDGAAAARRFVESLQAPE